MYDVLIAETGNEPEELKRYLVEEVGLEESAATAVVEGDREQVTTEETRSAAAEIAGDLEERSAEAVVDPRRETNEVTGSVTFDGERPEEAATVVAVDVHGDGERELGRRTLEGDDTYDVEYETAADRQVDLVVRVVSGDTTLATSDTVVEAGPAETVPLTVPAGTTAEPVGVDESDLFEFMMVRPAGLGTEESVSATGITGKTQFLQQLTEARDDGDRERMIESAVEYVESDAYAGGLDAASESLAALDERIAAATALTADDVRTMVRETFGESPSVVVASDDFRRAAERLTDSVTALSVTPGADQDTRRELMRGVKLADLVRTVADGTGTVDVASFLDRPLALSDDLFPLPGLSTETDGADGQSEATDGTVPDEAVKLHEQLETIQSARAELESVAGTAERPSVEDPDPTQTATKDSGVPTIRGPDGTLDTLSPETLDVVADVTGDDAPLLIEDAVDSLRRAERDLGSEFHRTMLDPAGEQRVRIGNDFHPLPSPVDEVTGGGDGLEALTGRIDEDPLPDSVFGEGRWLSDVFDTEFVNVLGIGSMKTVKRETTGYRMGELAHIENVLDGESKERVHEREEVTTETLITEQETTETRERDLQTSQRFEMERESEQTVKSKNSIDAGVNVSASYGPTVQVDAYTDYSRSQSREMSERAARRFSREVTKETVNRIKRRKLRRQIQKTKERVTETNTHGLHNEDGDGNLSGIYRWVDEIVRAQVFEHGSRLMLEFIVPEPAAFYRHAKASNPADRVSMEKPTFPKAPGFVWEDGEQQWELRPLEPKDLTNANYQYYATRYGATDVSPPPQPTIKRSKAVKKEGAVPEQDEKPVYKTFNVPIPEGYQARTASVAFSDVVRNRTGWRWKLQATVGDQAKSIGWRGTWGLDDPDLRTGDGLSGREILEKIQNRLPNNIIIPPDIANFIENQGPEIVEEVTGLTFDSITVPEDAQTYEDQLAMEEEQGPIALDDRDSSDDITPQTITQGINITGSSEGQQELPVTVFAYNLLGFGVTVMVTCRRTDEWYEDWQIKTYDKIRTAFENKLSEYQDKIDAARSEQGIEIEGNHPDENRRIEREELKRLAISMMREQHIDVDAVKDITEEDDREIPGVDFAGIAADNELIQFFEQAFEWNNMTYVFYPYFWTRRSKWAELEQYDANDPTFESFLRAGAARLIVPARPGFFDNVLTFLLTRSVEFGQPDLVDEEYVPIVTEIKESQGLDEDARDVRDSWTVRVPTELVKLQQSQDLPDLEPDVPDSG